MHFLHFGRVSGLSGGLVAVPWAAGGAGRDRAGEASVAHDASIRVESPRLRPQVPPPLTCDSRRGAVPARVSTWAGAGAAVSDSKLPQTD